MIDTKNNEQENPIAQQALIDYLKVKYPDILPKFSEQLTLLQIARLQGQQEIITRLEVERKQAYGEE